MVVLFFRVIPPVVVGQLSCFSRHGEILPWQSWRRLPHPLPTTPTKSLTTMTPTTTTTTMMMRICKSNLTTMTTTTSWTPPPPPPPTSNLKGRLPNRICRISSTWKRATGSRTSKTIPRPSLNWRREPCLGNQTATNREDEEEEEGRLPPRIRRRDREELREITRRNKR